MAKDLYDESRVMQEYFEEAANCLDINFVKLCFASSDAELARMENAYPALFLVSSSLAALLKEQGIVPDLVAGYGIGEYAAINAAGGLSLPDGLYMLSKFASLYDGLLQTLSIEGIKVTGLPPKKAEELCRKASSNDEQAFVGLVHDAQEVIILGDAAAIERVRQAVSEMSGVKIKKADVELGLHSALMDPVVAQVKMYVEKIDFKDVAVPFLSAVDAEPITQGDALKTAVIKQLHSPVAWDQIIKALEPYDLVIEVGPGTQLCSMLAMVYPNKRCVSINQKSDIEDVKKIIEQQTPQSA